MAYVSLFLALRYNNIIYNLHAIYSLNVSVRNIFQTDNFAIIWKNKAIPAKRIKWPKKVHDWLNSLSVWRKKQKHLCTVAV